MEERRLFKRFKVDIPVKFLVVEENREGTGKIVDISAAGVGLVVTLEKMQPLSHLDIWMEIPSHEEPFRASGQVVWLRQIQPHIYRVGVQFDKIDFMGMSKILRLKGALRETTV